VFAFWRQTDRHHRCVKPQFRTRCRELRLNKYGILNIRYPGNRRVVKKLSG